MNTLDTNAATTRALTALNSGRFRLSTEAEMQADIERALGAVFIPGQIVREARLSARDRPDFLLDGGVVVEVKHNRATAGSALRQLIRYADHEQVRALILATGRAMDMPRELNGKRVIVVELGRFWL